MKEKETQNRKTSFGIKQKILAIAFGPMTVLGIVVAIFSSSTMKFGMEDEAIKRLQDVASGVEQALTVVGDGDFQLNDGELYKGEHNISEDLTALEAFTASSEIDITLFWGDTRTVTTLIDEKTGERMVGTQAADQVAEVVLKNGNKYTDKDITINGKPYFCCYIPLKNGNGTIVGMIFAGEPSSGIEEYINNKMLQIILVIIVILILGGFDII
ncbi:MAG: hypothetical protein HFH48_10660, partial [Lachnospiraceae bacterium]|nr:hypothetical protein [Lachnospiraceae bacterium]